MPLSLKEKQIIQFGIDNGKTQQETIEALSKFRKKTQTSMVPISGVQDFVGDIKGIGSGIKEDITKRGLKLREIIDAQSRGQGVASTGFQLTGNFLGAFSDIAGQLIKGGTKAAISQEKEDKLKGFMTSIGEKVVAIPEVQEFIDNYEAIKAEDPEKARNIVALAEGGEFLLNFVGLTGAAKGGALGIRAGRKGLQEAAETGARVAAKTKSAVTPKPGVITGLASEARRIPSRIKTNIGAKQATEEAIGNIPSRIGRQAVRDGVEIADVQTLSIAASNRANREAIKDLANTVKGTILSSDKDAAIRAVGKPIVAKLKAVETAKNEIGKQIGKVANNLGKVTTVQLRRNIMTELKKVPGLSGLKIKNGLLDFSDTSLASSLSKADKTAINKIFAEATKGGTGKSKHLLRQELFEILGGKKRSLGTAITGTQEKAFEAVRRGLAVTLEQQGNAEYIRLAREFAKAARPLQDMRKMMRAAGIVDEDILEMSAGLIARRLTGSAASNPQIKTILRALDDVVADGANVADLQDVYNVLAKYYDLSGSTSFRGQIKGAIEDTGVKQVVQKIAGETPEVRQKAIQDLLDDLLK